MSDINRLPDDEMNLNDLPDSLRRAVEHIRSQPVPEASMQRAINRACAMKPTPRGRWFKLRPEIQVRIAVAAAILVAIGTGFLANLMSERGWSKRDQTLVALLDATGNMSGKDDIGGSPGDSPRKPIIAEIRHGTSNQLMEGKPEPHLHGETDYDGAKGQGVSSFRLAKPTSEDTVNLGPSSAGGGFKPTPPYGGYPVISNTEGGMKGGAPGSPGEVNSNKPGLAQMMNKMHKAEEDPTTRQPANAFHSLARDARPSPLQQPQSGPLNNGSLQPGFGFGRSLGGFGGTSGSFAGGGFGGGGFGVGSSGPTIMGGGYIAPGVFQQPSVGTVLGGKTRGSGGEYPLPLFHSQTENGGFNAAGDFMLFHQANPLKSLPIDVAKKVKETHTGSLLFGVGVNSDAGLTGSVALPGEKERKFTAKWGSMSQADRQKAVDDIIRELPAGYMEPVRAYFSNLEKSKSDKQPQVWHRDGQRPTFARVYLGGGNSLDLVSLQVSVNIEGPRARTVVDHIFHNPHDRQLEGTFEYPLPTGASVSYFGMFQGQTRPNAPPRFGNGGLGDQAPPLGALGDLPQPRSPTTQPGSPTALARMNPSDLAHHVSSADWGALQEARVVSKQKALETYEDIVRTRIDPALLEYSGGNTFTGRVFPIPPKGFNRVIIAYEELLPVVNEHTLYRFPLPNRKLSEMQLTLQANQADFTEVQFFPKEAKKETGGGQVVYSHTWKDTEAKGEVAFAGLPSRAQLQAITGRQGESGPNYLYARVRPQLKVETTRPFADHAVFMLDTSLSEHPDRFAVSMKLWQQILQSDPGIKKFNILAFNIGTSWIGPKGWLDNTAEGRGKAIARLDGIVLEGATDLSSALARLAPDVGRTSATRVAGDGPLAGLAKGTPLEIFLLSDGQVTWGNRDTNSLVANFESKCPYSARFHCYSIGLGAENLELFQALTRKGGGIYPCYSEAYLPYVARAHRSHCLLVERVSFKGGPAMTDVLVAGRQAAVYPGGELVVAARAAAHGRTKLVVEGTFLGERVVYEYPIEIGASSELAARSWGELAVSSLLALNDPKLDSLVTAYCQQFGIGSRVASFLVLENPADYKRLNLEEERGKVVPGGDLEKYLDDAWHNLARLIKPKQAFEHFLRNISGRLNLTVQNWGPNAGVLVAQFGVRPGPLQRSGQTSDDHIHRLFALLTDVDFQLPEALAGEAMVNKKEVPPAYLTARLANPLNVQLYLEEAKRRANVKDGQGALRVLSSVVELFPTRADALRLVGYRLLDMRQAAQAVRLFQHVEENRPFEPHSYRDMARSLEESGRYGFAALQYEIVLAGSWHNRFRDSLKEVAREEYAHMMQEALKEYRNPKSQIPISKELAEYFGERLEGLAGVRQQADLRVTISWNTDNTDVDLWVLEPDGAKCFYQNQKTSSGGQLSQDQTQGYGPERYQVEKALPGVYTVIVHYYRADANLLAGESHVNVLVTKYAGTPEETVERHTVLLKQANEQVEVCKMKVRQ